MRKRGFTGILLAGAALLPLSAAAQDIRDLDAEASNVRVFSGTVGSDPAVFEVGVPAGTSMRIDAISTSDLDPMLTVTDAATSEVLGEDDDSGGELNSRVTIRGEDGRRIRIAVSSFSYDALAAAENEQNGEDYGLGGGSFDLRLTTLAFTPQNTRSIAWGSAVGGTLLSEESHEFTFTGEPGQVLDVVLLAGEDGGLDPYLELRDEKGEVLASNDDSGDGLNSRIRHVMQNTGTYTIVAQAYGNSGGEYTLRVGERREAVLQAPVQMISIGGRAQGRLGEGYENGGIEPAYIDYQLDEEALAAIAAGGGQITIRMNKGEDEDPAFGNALDPMVEVGFDTPLGFAAVDSDDDSGGDLNAMLPIDLSSLAGDASLLSHLRIRVRAFSGSGGAYELRVTEGMEARPVMDDTPVLAPPMPVVRPAPNYD